MARVRALVDDDGNILDTLELESAPSPDAPANRKPAEKPVPRDPDPEVLPTVKPAVERSFMLDIFWSSGEREHVFASVYRVESGALIYRKGKQDVIVNIGQTRSITAEEVL